MHLLLAPHCLSVTSCGNFAIVPAQPALVLRDGAGSSGTTKGTCATPCVRDRDDGLVSRENKLKTEKDKKKFNCSETSLETKMASHPSEVVGQVEREYTDLKP